MEPTYITIRSFKFVDLELIQINNHCFWLSINIQNKRK